MSDQLDQLVVGVRRTRRLQFQRACILGFLALAAVSLLTFLAYAGLDLFFKFTVAERIPLFLLTLLVLAAAVERFALRPARDARPDPAVAGDIETRHPQMETVLSTSLEYGGDAAKTEAFSSPPIVDRLVNQAVHRSAQVRFEDSVDWRLPRWAAVGTAAALAGLALGFHHAPTLFGPAFRRFVNPWARVEPPTLARVESVSPGTVEVPARTPVTIEARIQGFPPDRVQLHYRHAGKPWHQEDMLPFASGRFAFTFREAREDFDYYVQARDHRSPGYSLSVYVEPAVEQVSALLTYPSYTGLEPVRIEKNTGDLQALAGTEVELEVQSNVPVSQGQILFQEAEAGGLVPSGARRLHGRFTIARDDHYALKLFDGRGRTHPNLFWHAVRALEDAAPRVRITRPDPDLLAQDDQEVVVQAEAEDDFGLIELGVAFYVLGEDEIRETLKSLEKPLRHTRSIYRFDLGRMLLPPGAVLAYYVYALDNDTVNGPKEGVSVLQFVRVYEATDLAGPDSMEGDAAASQARQAMMANLEQIVGQQIQVLANTFQIAGTPPGRRTSAQQEALETLGKKEKELTGQVESLAQHIEQALEAAEIEEMPEVHALREAVSALRESSWYLHVHEAHEALNPEKNALHQLSQARRLVLSLAGQPGRQQAYLSALSQQQGREREKERSRAQEFQKMAQEMPKMLERQEKSRRELEQLAKQEEQNREADETEQPQDWSSYQKREELADEMREAMYDAFELARRMAREAESDSPMARRAAEQMNQTAEQMYRSKRALEFREYQEAHSQAREAERGMREAERSLHNAMRRDISQAMQSAGERAGALARQQESLSQETEEEARRTGAASAGPEEAPAEPPAEHHLARRQDELRRDAASLGRELEDLAARAEQGDRTQDQADLAQSARELTEGAAAEAMSRAASAMEAGQPGQAVPHQQQAQKSLRDVGSRLAQAVARSQGEDDEKVRQMMEETERLAREQRNLNRQAGRTEERDGLAARQSGMAAQARALGERTRQAGVLADAGLAEETRQAYEAAAREMESVLKALAAPGEMPAAPGEEAERHLGSALENLRAAADRSLGNRLGLAAALAQSAAEQERRTEDDLRAGSENRPPDQPFADGTRRSAARSQAQAAQAGKGLALALQVLSKAAEKSDPWVARDIAKERSRLEERDVVPEMERLARALSPDSDPLPVSKAGEAREKAGEIARVMEEVQHELEKVHLDYLATPLERLQSVQKKLNETLADLARIESGIESQIRLPEGERRGSEDRLAQAMERLEQQLDELSDRMARSAGQPPADGQGIGLARELLSGVRAALGVHPGGPQWGNLLSVREHLQTAREGVIERIQRILRKRDIREPGSERVPEEYEDLVKRYYRVLSEDK
ncbi:MAG: hypothetical protein HYU36_20585 [Planctomycetes bacterium]|nr:hypothetical protein [Planctomycetota bacterium]